MKAYVIGVRNKNVCCTDLIWCDEYNAYYSNSPFKRIRRPKLTDIEKERLALLKLSSEGMSIRHVGRVMYGEYYVIREHQE